MLLHMRTINRECPAAGFEMFRTRTWAGRRTRFSNGDRADGDVRSHGYTLGCDTMVNNPVMLALNSVCHDCPAKDSRDMLAR